jgi:hypothetical protein
MGGQGQVDVRPGSGRWAARVRLIGGQGQLDGLPRWKGVHGQVDGRPGSGRWAARVR